MARKNRKGDRREDMDQMSFDDLAFRKRPAPEDEFAPREEPVPEDEFAPREEPVPEDEFAPREEPVPEDEFAPREEPAPEDEFAPQEEFVPQEEPMPEEGPVPEEEPEAAAAAYYAPDAEPADGGMAGIDPAEGPAWIEEPAGKTPAADRVRGVFAKAKGLLPVRKGGRAPDGEERPGRGKKREDEDLQEMVVRATPVIGRDLKGGQMLVYDSELDEVDYSDPEDLPEARDYLPIRFRRYGRIGIGGGILYALFVISVSIVLACFAWMCAVDVLALNKEDASAIVTIYPYEPEGDMPTTVTREDENGDPVEVPIKVDIDQVADALKNGGIIEYKWLFKVFAAVSHANIKIDPGTYDLRTTQDYRSLVTKMQFGSDSQEVTRVTFPEGFSMEQIFTLLEQEFVCKKEDLYETAANFDFPYDFLAEVPLGDASRLEGFLFPDTYEFYQGEDPDVCLSRFLNNFQSKLTDEIKNNIAARGLSLRQGIIMASLIEKEAGGAENEREQMASVIYNRLAAGMPLGLDSTINFIKGTNTFDFTEEDLAIDSPYNTYLYQGLPPGPICSPGLAAIQAVANPADTGYYYWYSVDGVSSFFATLEEQQAFAQANPY